MSTHKVAHENNEAHRQSPKAPTPPNSNHKADESILPEIADNPGNCGHVGHSLAQIELIVIDSPHRQNEGNINGDHQHQAPAKQKDVQKESGVKKRLLVDSRMGEHHFHEVCVVDNCYSSDNPKCCFQFGADVFG